MERGLATAKDRQHRRSRTIHGCLPFQETSRQTRSPTSPHSPNLEDPRLPKYREGTKHTRGSAFSRPRPGIPVAFRQLKVQGNALCSAGARRPHSINPPAKPLSRLTSRPARNTDSADRAIPKGKQKPLFPSLPRAAERGSRIRPAGSWNRCAGKTASARSWSPGVAGKDAAPVKEPSFPEATPGVVGTVTLPWWEASSTR